MYTLNIGDRIRSLRQARVMNRTGWVKLVGAQVAMEQRRPPAQPAAGDDLGAQPASPAQQLLRAVAQHGVHPATGRTVTTAGKLDPLSSALDGKVQPDELHHRHSFHHDIAPHEQGRPLRRAQRRCNFPKGFERHKGDLRREMCGYPEVAVPCHAQPRLRNDLFALIVWNDARLHSRSPKVAVLWGDKEVVEGDRVGGHGRVVMGELGGG